MIPHTQTIFVNDPRGIPGDCMRTAVASLLDLPTEAVPHFAVFDDWFGAFTLWLKGRGLRIWGLREDDVDRPCLALGKSPRGVEHIVVWGPDGLMHDPHPSRSGIEARQFWALVPNGSEPTERYPDCPRHPHSWVDCPGAGPEDHDPSRPSTQPPDPASAPWDRPDGCFGHCDPEGWHAPCRQATEQESR